MNFYKTVELIKEFIKYHGYEFCYNLALNWVFALNNWDPVNGELNSRDLRSVQFRPFADTVLK